MVCRLPYIYRPPKALPIRKSAHPVSVCLLHAFSFGAKKSSAS
ncbi:hypothetical protein HMPREF3213_02161 [Heyndrickxia coagulans]|uniref:Uncharacterized protein n=1 Tax=Heyndrickxia coagulans TaxID=1398 RepID=A0A133KNF1_HEYCO|nr:hypothetical protein HMPREF3213_02161 [Heyndrickxia coagulans]